MKEDKKELRQSKLDTALASLTKSIGSIPSVIIHTILFATCFVLGFVGYDWNSILLVLTTLVSLEAIYLSIFIQMTVNRNTESLEEVEVDIDEIQEDIDDIQEDVDEIQEDVDEIQEDVDDIKEDVVEMTDEEKEMEQQKETEVRLEKIQHTLQMLLQDVEKLKK